MREAGRSQQARGRHVVDEVGNSNQAGSGKQRQAATEKFLTQSFSLHPRSARRMARRRVSDSDFPRECHDPVGGLPQNSVKWTIGSTVLLPVLDPGKS